MKSTFFYIFSFRIIILNIKNEQKLNRSLNLRKKTLTLKLSEGEKVA